MRSRHRRRCFGVRQLAATCIVALVLTEAAPAGGQRATEEELPGDPVLARLIEESLAARPELRQARALVQAERERIPQAGALPDPVLGLGIQNDSFDRIEIGEVPQPHGCRRSTGCAFASSTGHPDGRQRPRRGGWHDRPLLRRRRAPPRRREVTQPEMVRAAAVAT